MFYSWYKGISELTQREQRLNVFNQWGRGVWSSAITQQENEEKRQGREAHNKRLEAAQSDVLGPDLEGGPGNCLYRRKL